MPRAQKRTPKQPARPSPRLPRASEGIKRFANLLETEILAWPGVSSRPMFGLNGVYRDKEIFAVLPRTRTMNAPNSIAFRLARRSTKITGRMQKDERIVLPAPRAKWISFIIESELDISDALQWLALAYREAAKN